MRKRGERRKVVNTGQRKENKDQKNEQTKPISGPVDNCQALLVDVVVPDGPCVNSLGTKTRRCGPTYLNRVLVPEAKVCSAMGRLSWPVKGILK